MAFSAEGTTHRSTVTGRRGVVSSAHPLATLAGMRMLMQGGNAIDAIVATAAALNVVEPYMSGIAGDGYMHIHSKQKGEHKILDYMGKSPIAAELSKYDTDAKRFIGSMTPIIPGACGGWLAALDRYGTMDAATVFAPAIEYAEQGFALTVKNAAFFNYSAETLAQFPSSSAYMGGNAKRRPGDVVIQTDLANTFRTVAEGGADVFYRGELADKLVRFMESSGGLITHDDLRAFEVEWTDPVCIDYRGYKVFAPPPPCQAVQYLETLNIMEGYDVAGMGHNSAETLHTFLEAAKLSVADRIAYSAIATPPTSGLLSKAYAARQRSRISPRAQPTEGDRYQPNKSAEVLPGDPYHFMNTECTTHFDAVDADGNSVAVTQSLGALFGSGVVVPGTGMALNNFMRWMDVEPDSPNVIGSAKKLEMCMSPVQVWDDNGPRLLIGTPGSYGILQTTPQMIMNFIDHKMNVQAAIEAARVKATTPGYLVDAETRISAEVLKELEARGHEINRIGEWSMMVGGGQGIAIDYETGSLMGGADPRRDGYAMGW